MRCGGWLFGVAGVAAMGWLGGCGGGNSGNATAAPVGDAGVPLPHCADGGLLGCGTEGDVVAGFGGPGRAPFPDGEDGSGGVLSGGGPLRLEQGDAALDLPPLIWIANSDEGTISKIDTRTLRELGRYRTGPVTAPGTPDPSRTTVGLDGDVVVANRAGGSATRIAADPSRCRDRDGNGRIDSSSGPADVRPWGQDECVLWNTPLGADSLPRAAAFDGRTGIDGGDASTVWIGLYNRSQVVQLDPRDGRVLATVDVAPVTPYGAAVDRAQDLWVWGGGGVVRVESSGSVTHVPDPPCGYGIAVDGTGRVWTSGMDCVARYSPAEGAWRSVHVGTENRGIALDGRGSVWVADTDFGVHQLDEESLRPVRDLFLPWQTFVGIAVDADRRVWAIARGSSAAVRIDPARLPSPDAIVAIKTGQGPYTYSDMTGFQLRNAAAASGHWRHVFAGCGPRTRFTHLGLATTLPPGTAVDLAARTAGDRAALASSAWTHLATLPPARGPVDVEAALGPAATAAWLELDVTLRSASAAATPTVDRLELAMDCLPVIQ